jgi:hypothetical protein
VSELPGRRAPVPAGRAWARCTASAAPAGGIGLAGAGPICGTEAARGILRPPGGAWSRAGGAAAVRCLSIARAILTARMLDKAWREVPAAVAGRSLRPA